MHRRVETRIKLSLDVRYGYVVSNADRGDRCLPPEAHFNFIRALLNIGKYFNNNTYIVPPPSPPPAVFPPFPHLHLWIQLMSMSYLFLFIVPISFSLPLFALLLYCSCSLVPLPLSLPHLYFPMNHTYVFKAYLL